MLRYYSKIEEKVVEVMVSDVVASEVRRSYWREQKQRERYYKKCTLLEDGYGYSGVDSDFVSKFIRDEEIRVLRKVLKTLDEKQMSVIQCIYYDEMNLTETAKVFAVSVPYMSRYHKKLKDLIRERFLKMYNGI